MKFFIRFSVLLLVLIFHAESLTPAQDAICLRREGETIFCYSACENDGYLCLEEEFDLGDDEVLRVEKFKGADHLYFVLETPYPWFYVLFVKPGGMLELRRFCIP
ncbi:MAG: hypothetical protein KBS64_02075 [Treponema sp.]|nr:hypothetical protein [Candidatus Treponema equi]